MIAGKYQILRELGHGGMGVVYLASHVEMGRQCALKMLRSETVDDAAMIRFHREARSASRISHPNVVSVYDFGKIDDGSAYLAMELVEGRTLSDVLKEEGPFKPRRAARIVWQVADGLTVAHDLEIVHRDLKPANIMLTRYRSWDDFVKVVDFGVAKALGLNTTSQVTSTGLRIGTPAYMSPEQWIGGEVDHRSDIYSLALIALEMLSGSAPTVPLGLVSGAQPTLRGLADSGGWPAEVTNVLERALATNPQERQASAAEFAAEFVSAVSRWEESPPGVREPWEERLPTSLSTRASRKTRVLPFATASIGGIVTIGVLWLGLGNARQDAVTSDSASVIDSGSKETSTAANSISRDNAVGKQAIVTPDSPSRLGGATSSQGAVDSVLLLREIFNLNSPDADSARRVIAIADRLLSSSLGDSARIEVWYRIAEARFFLDEVREACQALRRAQALSSRSGYFARSIEVLNSGRC